MGLDVGLVLSDARHYGAYVCAICQNLCDLDALVTTGCSHAFCKSCLQNWLERKTTLDYGNQNPTPLCPTCNRNLLYSEAPGSSNNNHNGNKNTSHMMMGGRATLVQPLKHCQPLAYRVLSQILVACPLQGVQCTWKGDYGDLQYHLLSKTAHTAEDECCVVVPTMTADDNTTTATSTESAATTASADLMQTEEEELSQAPPPVLQQPPPPRLPPPPPPPETTAPDRATPSIREQQQANELLQLKKRSLASSFKDEANSQFASGHFSQARSLYTKALEIFWGGKSSMPTGNTAMEGILNEEEDKQLVATLYCNRAAAHLTLQCYHDCIEDCQKVLEIDGTHVKAYVRIGRAYIQQGEFTKASNILEQGYSRTTSSNAISKEWLKAQQLVQLSAQADQQLLQKDHAMAKATFGRILLDAPSAPHLLLGAAKADLGLGLTDSALRLTKKVLTNHPQNAEACHIRGQASFFMGGNDLQVGIKLVQEALRLDPDSSSIKASFRRYKQVKTLLQDATAESYHRRFEAAATALTEAIQAMEQDGQLQLPRKSRLFAEMYTQRAEVYLRLKQYQSALRDCSLVVYAQEDHVPAWLIKVQAYHGLGRHEQALEELSDLLGGGTKGNTNGHGSYGEQETSWGASDERLRKAYEHAEFLVRKQKRPNYYGLMGVSSIASELEIKKAYKKRAMELHPDKHATKSAAEQKESEKQFQLLGEGLEILCNEFTRQLYDEGYDPEAIRNRVEAAQQAAHHHGHGARRGNPHGHYH
jgi:DnaJ homolog subfamily C member 7